MGVLSVLGWDEEEGIPKKIKRYEGFKMSRCVRWNSDGSLEMRYRVEGQKKLGVGKCYK
jgi:hypothetical protein